MEPWLKRLLDREQSARLATSGNNQAHIVPVVLVRDGEKIFVPIDGKPKSGRKLRRNANIESNPHVSLLLDLYSDDWDELWWVRIDGTAKVCALQDHTRQLLVRKYPQYEEVDTGEAVIEIEPTATARWAASARTSAELFDD